MKHVQNLVDAQFKVRTYFILFSSLCLCILNYLVTFYVLFHWSDKSYTFFYMYDSLFVTWTAILVCLEHSFWIVQKGSNSKHSFTKAWNIYLQTQHALVDQALDDYLRLKGSNDWFTIKHYPSEEERAEYVQIVLNNLLCRFSLCLLWVDLLIYLQPIPQPLLDNIRVCLNVWWQGHHHWTWLICLILTFLTC